MEAQDGIIAGPALVARPGERVDGIIGGPSLPPGAGPARPVAKRVGRPREPPRAGAFTCWFVGEPNAEPAPETGAALERHAPDPSVVAVGRCTWEFAPPDAIAAREHVYFQRLSPQHRHLEPEWGYIQYKVREVWQFPEALPVPDLGVPLEDPCAPRFLYNELADACVDAEGTTVFATLSRFPRESMAIVVLYMSFLTRLFWNVPPRPVPFRSFGGASGHLEHYSTQPAVGRGRTLEDTCGSRGEERC